MENIFKKIIIPMYFFNDTSNDMADVLFYVLYSYLYDNLDDENNNIFRQDLKDALTNNANGKYI
jgi:hypothetical protein